jgi:hypothetical protein
MAKNQKDLNFSEKQLAGHMRGRPLLEALECRVLMSVATAQTLHSDLIFSTAPASTAASILGYTPLADSHSIRV